MGRIASCLVLAATLSAARPARAEDATERHVSATLSSGTLLPPDHVYKLGLVGFSAPPTIYMGVSVEGDLARRLRIEGSLGVELALGFVAGSSLRYVPVDRSGLSLSLGAGPLLALGSSFGTGVFAGADIGARYVIAGSPFVIALNLGLAFALNDAGTAWCGVDTCDAYIRRGDRLESVIASLGYAFRL